MIYKIVLETIYVFTWLQLTFLPSGNAIWLPSHNISLHHEEEFVISELLDNSDVEDVYEDEEMIKDEYVALKIDQKEHPDKYYRLHRQAVVHNEKLTVAKPQPPMKTEINESNPHLEEYLPWVAGIVDDKNEFRKDSEMFYFDDEARSNQSLSEKLIEKREEATNQSANYDYQALKSEYDKQVKEEEKKSDALKYNDTKEDESPKEAVQTLADFSPRNCTPEELKGISFASVECFWIEMKKPRFGKGTKLRILEKIIRIFLLWLLVYLLIALPLWCQYGWCCCCCRCKFCRPNDVIDEVKSFYANNPVGVYHDDEGNVFKYEPTNYERYAQRKLQKAIEQL